MSIDLSIRIIGFTEANQNIEQLRTGLQNLSNAQTASNNSARQSQPINEEQIRQTIQTKIEKQNLITAIKNEVVINSSAEGSYRSLNSQLIQLKNQYKALSEEERNSASGNAMLQNIKEQDVNIKKLSASMGEHQREVGNYSEGVKKGLEGIGEKASEGVGGVGKLATTLGKLGPIGLGVGVAIGVLAGIWNTFAAGTQEGMDRQKVRLAGLGGAWDVVSGKIAKVGKGMDDMVGGDKLLEQSHFWTYTLTYVDALLGGLTNLRKTGEEMDRASDKAKQIAYERIQLEKEEISLIPQRAKASEGLTRARLEAADENKTIAEKIELNKKVLEQENEIAKKEIESAEKKLALDIRTRDLAAESGKATREQEKQIAESKADIYNKTQESERRELKLIKENTKLETEARKEEMDLQIAIAKNVEEKRTAQTIKFLNPIKQL